MESTWLLMVKGVGVRDVRKEDEDERVRKKCRIKECREDVVVVEEGEGGGEVGGT